MVKVIGGAQEGEFKAVASGTLPNGKPVVVNADGTVSVVSETNLTQAAGNTTQISNLVNGDYFAATYDANAQKVVIAYKNVNSSNRGEAIVGTVSGESISFGSENTFNSGGTTEIEIAYDANAQKVVIIYRNTSGSNYGTAIVGTVSGTSISFGSPVVFNSALTQAKSISYDSSNQVVVVSYRNGASSNRGQAVVGTISGTSISFGSVATFNSQATNNISSCYDVASGKTVVVYEDEGNSQEGTAVVGTVSGTSISFGSEATFSGGYSINVVKAAYDEKSEKVVIGYHASSSYSGSGTAIVGTVSGTSISFGSAVTFDSSNIRMKSIVYNAASQNIVLCYTVDSSLDIEAIVGTVSGTSISFGGAVTLDSGGGQGSIISSAYDASEERVVVCFKDTADSNKAKATIFRTSYTSRNLTAENYIGMSSGGISPDALGSPTVFEAADNSYIASAYDANTQKVVIVYQDAGNSSYGTAIVGTVSGTSISFGSSAVFESATTSVISVCYDANAQKVVVSYRDGGNSNYGTAIVGTVSGTSISFGSPTVFLTGEISSNSITYDTNAQKVVVAYRDNSNSSYGTAIVGTVSGTSISFGSSTVFESASIDWPSAVYDANAQKIVIAYKDGGNSNYGTAIVGTVSGTSISFGSAVVFESASSVYNSAVYDALAKKVVIAFRGTSNYGRVVSGTVSGTSISFDSPVTFNSNTSNWTAAVYDTNAERVAIAYHDNGNSSYGTGIVYKTGFAGEVADGGTASIDIIGSLSTNQDSLTAGQQYFVQTDGTIGTTADSPSVLAGTAISATELLVKT